VVLAFLLFVELLQLLSASRKLLKRSTLPIMIASLEDEEKSNYGADNHEGAHNPQHVTENSFSRCSAASVRRRS
jgi:hypothetical protein